MKKLRKRSDLPNWFDLDHYSKIVAPEDWASAILLRWTVQRLWQDRDDAKKFFVNILFNNEISSSVKSAKHFPITELTAFDAIVLNGCYKKEKFDDARKFVDTYINGKSGIKDKDKEIDWFLNNRDKYHQELGMAASDENIELLEGDIPELLSGYPITINLDLDDDTLIEFFKIKLLRIREGMGRKYEKPFSKNDLLKWHKYRILAVFDLDLWAKISNVKFTDSLISNVLWPADSQDTDPDETFSPIDRLRKTSRPLAEEIICMSMHNKLSAQLEMLKKFDEVYNINFLEKAFK